ncbi:diguanylate cyclase [Magnetospirillum sp. 64-120]|uniref:diguanylate cyclase domain-containing protein n=1 Tax=Magnetospirillum sp. 64-120 TaxID=1895778 RepID=UPI0025C182CA|nr:diguanylate cyclase [Magnetospirillum sp. 64-120]
MGRLSIRTRLYGLVLVMLALVGFVLASGLSELREHLLAERHNQSRVLVHGALGYMERLESMVQAGALSRDEAMARAVSAVAAMSSRQGDYLWINDLTPRMVWHPMGELVGRDLSDFANPDNRTLFREFVDLTAADGTALVTYRWIDPKTGQLGDKVSYVERFAPWGWIVGSGLYLDDIHAAWRKAAWNWGASVALALLFCLALAWMFGHSITGPLSDVTLSMRQLTQGHDVEVPQTGRLDEIGDLTRAMAVFRQALIQRQQAQAAHDRVLAQAKTVFDHISEAVMLTDQDNRILMVNPSFTRITGYSLDEVVGRDPGILASGRHDEAFYQAMWDELRQSGEWHGEMWNRMKSGEIFPESLSITRLSRPDGGIHGYVATFQDITDRKRREARVRWRAEHDPLTGLLNREMFEIRLAETVRVSAECMSLAALLYLDLDGFKPVNDELGHAAGDLVLKNVAKRIEAAVRGGDVVARLGGDEFAVLIGGLAVAEDASRIAAKLAAALGQPIDLDGCLAQVGTSIGIALFPRDGDTPAALLAAADSAMYQAKRQGGRGYAFASPSNPGGALVTAQG